MEQPAADAGAAVGMFTGRLEGALQHVPTHTAQKTLVHIAHKPLQIIAHPAATQEDYTNMTKDDNKTLDPISCLIPFENLLLSIYTDNNIPT